MRIIATFESVRFRELDALRGIAALWVVLFHYLTRYDQIYSGTEPTFLGSFSFPDGLNAVALFFMISGFVIFMTLRHCRGAADFIVSRFSRLYPAYWAAIAVTSVTLLLMPLPGEDFSLSRIIVNATMLQQYGFVKHIDGAYWSLTYEITFYAILLALYLAGLMRRIETVCWIWLALTAAVNLAALFDAALPSRLHILLIASYAQYFIAGIVFHNARETGYTPNRVRLLAACLVAAFIADPYEGAAAYAAIAFIVFHFCITGRLTWLATAPVLQWLGAISYPLYLTHQMIGYRLIASLLERGVPAPVVVVAAIGTALALATLLSRSVERPAMRLIRQSYRRIVAARVAPAV